MSNELLNADPDFIYGHQTVEGILMPLVGKISDSNSGLSNHLLVHMAYTTLDTIDIWSI
jgi:hypothetical protein